MLLIDMDLQSSKLELVRLILKIDNQQIINKLTAMLKEQDQDFWNELSDQQKEEIKLGIKQLDDGQRISLEEFISKHS
jgi:hypothetical protein